MDAVTLTSAHASVRIALRGAEPVAWSIGGLDLMWSGDPAIWGRVCPVLFPIVGRAANDEVRVDKAAHPIGRHGFAATCRFRLTERGTDYVRLELRDGPETRGAWPFPFRLSIVWRLTPETLAARVEVENTGSRAMPYAFGLHPGFAWPFAATDRRGHEVVFSRNEQAAVPEITPDGYITDACRPVPMDGRRLLLDALRFDEALCFLEAASDRLTFRAPGGGAIAVAAKGFRHWAIWTRPGAPFLSLECWTGHADAPAFDGELADKPSMLHLVPGAIGHHAATFNYEAAA